MKARVVSCIDVDLIGSISLPPARSTEQSTALSLRANRALRANRTLCGPRSISGNQPSRNQLFVLFLFVVFRCCPPWVIREIRAPKKRANHNY